VLRDGIKFGNYILDSLGPFPYTGGVSRASGFQGQRTEMSNFIAFLTKPTGEKAYINTFNDTGDEIVYFRDQAEHFSSYSAAMNAVVNTDTRGWNDAGIEEV